MRPHTLYLKYINKVLLVDLLNLELNVRKFSDFVKLVISAVIYLRMIVSYHLYLFYFLFKLFKSLKKTKKNSEK